jgi:outer membrane lipoprotein-sorting protein
MNPIFLSGFPFRFLSAACCGLFAMLPAAETAAQQPERPPLTAQEILQRMADRYATWKSYRDSGVVKSVDIDAEGKKVKEKRFTTAFSRPDRFRYGYSYRLPQYGLYRYIIWAQGDDVRTYWDATPPAQQHPSLLAAIIGALGVTKMTAYFIPALLMAKQLEANTLADNLEKAERLEDAKLGEHDCFCVGGEFSKYSMTLWIDKASFLLRQIQINADFSKFRSETMIT